MNRITRVTKRSVYRCVLGVIIAALYTLPAYALNGLPRPDHIVIVMEENHAYGDIIGSSRAPYINSLAAQGALFTNAFAIEHPSATNYLDIFSGSNQGIKDDTCPHSFTVANLGSELIAASLTFSGYSEDMPSVGFTDCSFNLYRRKHNPWVNFTNVPPTDNLPLTNFPADYSTLPTVSFVIPNLANDMHDGTIVQGDTWLKTNIDGYAQWAKTHNSLLIVTWDESYINTTNQIPTFFVGQMVTPGQYSETINHYSVLRTIEDMYALPYLGNSSLASDITDCWLATAPPGTPGGLTATGGGAQISLTWKATPGATSYNVKRGTASGGPYAVVGHSATASYTDIGLTIGKTYYYVVSAVNPLGESGNSSEVSAVPLTSVPFDFNGDGKPDLVLQSTSTNKIALWYMKGANVIGGQYVSLAPPTGWKVVGVGDFNGDGKPDLVLHNAATNQGAIWYLNGASVIGGQMVSLTLPAGWSIAGVGDFNGDGKPDLVLRHDTSNHLAIWYMNGASVLSTQDIPNRPAPGWTVVAAGDFNGDGKPDLVLQNATTNQIAFWYMNGATLLGGQYVSAIPPAGWDVVGVGDFNSDGKPDLVLLNDLDKQVGFWYLNGASVVNGQYASLPAPQGWHIVGPR